MDVSSNISQRHTSWQLWALPFRFLISLLVCSSQSNECLSSFVIMSWLPLCRGMDLTTRYDVVQQTVFSVVSAIRMFWSRSRRGPSVADFLLQYFHYYGIFYLGCSEVSTIPLVFLDLAKFFPPQPDTPFEHFVNGLCGPAFAVTFTFYRVIQWWIVGYQMFSDIFAVVKDGSANKLRPGRNHVLYVMMALNLLLGLLQLYWFQIILGEAVKVLGFENASDVKEELWVFFLVDRRCSFRRFAKRIVLRKNNWYEGRSKQSVALWVYSSCSLYST